MRKKRKAYYCEERQSWVIHLNTGQAVLIDAEDAIPLSRYSWAATYSRGKQIPYAKAKIDGKNIRMHRLLLNAPTNLQVDHINGNSLDNRKENLRLCTHRENQQNRSVHRDGRLCGTAYNKPLKKWRAKFTKDRKAFHIGYYETELEAHQAYKDKIEELGLA